MRHHAQCRPGDGGAARRACTSGAATCARRRLRLVGVGWQTLPSGANIRATAEADEGMGWGEGGGGINLVWKPAVSDDCRGKTRRSGRATGHPPPESDAHHRHNSAVRKMKRITCLRGEKVFLRDNLDIFAKPPRSHPRFPWRGHRAVSRRQK